MMKNKVNIKLGEVHNCDKCNKEKVIYSIVFNKSKIYCRACFRRTPKVFLSEIYTRQLQSSKYRKMPPPSYSAKELKRWILLNPLFRPLYITWLKSGYKTELIPSIDRLNDYLPYTLDNIQLMTWAENKIKGERETKEGKKYNKVKSVVCLEKDTERFINQYYSYHEAMRDTSIRFNTIASAVSKNIESKGVKNYLGGGYYWCDTLVYMNYMLQDIENTERSVKTDKIEYSNIIFDEETSTVSIKNTQP